MRRDEMTARRFRDLVEAFGADPARWPEMERGAACAYSAAHADEVAPWLEEARGLDALLELDAEDETVSERLQYQTVARMIAANDIAGPMPAPRRRVPVMWAAGVGLAACLAGALVGVNLGLKSMDDMRAQAVLEQAQMIDAENG
ncbi:MAG: hypothetical protein JF615_12885 [Asticcacaulis sp.]|nr:hypothetical protein [Asticcacaulis sp.]